MNTSVDFITNLPLTVTSGGWGGISANIFDQLGRRGMARFVGPIDPPTPVVGKALAKLRRLAGARSNFAFFGEPRLQAIAKAYEAQRSPGAGFALFHGQTPWVRCRPSGPYGAYIDATFRMYLDIYSDPQSFLPEDVTRIARAEKAWLRGASALFFGSRWVRDIAVGEHDLDEARAHVIWVGGNVPAPEQDIYAGGHSFLFISLNFEKKGGLIAVEALKRVREQAPEAELVVIGQRPPPEVEATPGVRYVGRLDKNKPEDLAVFCGHLASARALVHPTAMDTMGMVLIEAAYFGCPAIASRRFGIPELVLDGETGLLVDPPIRVEDVAEAMGRMCLDGPAYDAMRRRAREHATRNLTWDVFGERLWNGIRAAVEAPTAVEARSA